MDVSLITLPKGEAAAKFQIYKKRLAKLKHRDTEREVRREYEAALRGYQQLAKGTPLLDLDTVMENCPLDEKGRPKLAIAAAHMKQVKVIQANNERTILFQSDIDRWGLRSPKYRIRCNLGRLPIYGGNSWDRQGFTLIPMVPLNIRPETGALQDYFILWEVQKWEDKQINNKPSRDPYLLKHLGGSLYAVIAEWDLTDLEMSIMKGRA